ncbi:MAG: J domain-containing protein [Bacteroidota bacterium]
MQTQYFQNCNSLEEVKRRYKELAMKHHPDRGGDTATMQQINCEYESMMKNPIFEFSKQTEQEQQEYIRYPEIINQVIGLEGIIIELIGNWIWISGNTYPYKDKLRQVGFYFAPKKVMWYFRPPDYKSPNRSPKTIEYIRNKYGSDLIETRKRKFELQN